MSIRSVGKYRIDEITKFSMGLRTTIVYFEKDGKVFRKHIMNNGDIIIIILYKEPHYFSIRSVHLDRGFFTQQEY